MYRPLVVRTLPWYVHALPGLTNAINACHITNLNPQTLQRITRPLNISQARGFPLAPNFVVMSNPVNNNAARPKRVRQDSGSTYPSDKRGRPERILGQALSPESARFFAALQQKTSENGQEVTDATERKMERKKRSMSRGRTNPELEVSHLQDGTAKPTSDNGQGMDASQQKPKRNQKSSKLRRTIIDSSGHRDKTTMTKSDVALQPETPEKCNVMEPAPRRSPRLNSVCAEFAGSVRLSKSLRTASSTSNYQEKSTKYVAADKYRPATGFDPRMPNKTSAKSSALHYQHRPVTLNPTDHVWTKSGVFHARMQPNASNSSEKTSTKTLGGTPQQRPTTSNSSEKTSTKTLGSTPQQRPTTSNSSEKTSTKTLGSTHQQRLTTSKSSGKTLGASNSTETTCSKFGGSHAQKQPDASKSSDEITPRTIGAKHEQLPTNSNSSEKTLSRTLGATPQQRPRTSNPAEESWAREAGSQQRPSTAYSAEVDWPTLGGFDPRQRQCDVHSDENRHQESSSKSAASDGDTRAKPSSRYNRQWKQVNGHGTSRISHKKGLYFSVMSYNILSQKLIEDNAYLYTTADAEHLEWDYRKENLTREIRALSPDIMCLQEVQEDHYQEFILPYFTSLGYNGLYKKRTGEKPDGCALLFKQSKFDLVSSALVEFSRGIPILNRDNVGIVAMLKSKTQRRSAKFCVATTHLLYNPKRVEIRLAQLAVLLAEIDKMMKENGKCPLILCGDLNELPYGPLLHFITTGRVQFGGPNAEFRTSQGWYLDKNLLPPPGLNTNCEYENEATPRDGAMRHGNRLVSVYKSFTKRNGKRFGEVTTRHDRANECVDYIFYTVEDRGPSANQGVWNNYFIEGALKLLEKWDLLTYDEARREGCLPNRYYGSDHLALMCRFHLAFDV